MKLSEGSKLNKLVMNKKQGDHLYSRSIQKNDLSKRAMGSSHLLLLLNNILSIDGWRYKVIESLILSEIFFMSQNHVNHTTRNKCKKYKKNTELEG